MWKTVDSDHLTFQKHSESIQFSTLFVNKWNISITGILTLNAPIATKVVCFSHLLKCLEASMANSVDPDQTAPIGAFCSGSTLFASKLNLSVM